MTAFFQYCLQSGIVLIVLYLFYWLVLRKDTHFWLNRFILVFSGIISMVLPAVSHAIVLPGIENIPLIIEFGPQPQVQEAGSVYQAAIPDTASAWSLGKMMLWLYLGGAFIVAARLIYQAIFLHAVSKLSDKSVQDGFTIYSMKTDMIPFSYFNRIFIPADRIDEESLDSVLSHEKSHLHQGHYIDLFIMQIITIFQWFNPFAWLFEKALKEVHEYLADEAVLDAGKSKGKYQALLVNQALGGPVFIFTNQFNQSIIKKRIMMMKNVKTPGIARLKALLIVPLIAGMLLAFANPPLDYQLGGEKITVNGSVTDRFTGKPVAGAVLVIKGTTVGTISDNQGNYQLIVNGAGDQLVVSHIGFKTQEVPVGNNTRINVQMEQDVLAIDFSSGNKLDRVAEPIAGKPDQEQYVFVEALPSYPGGTEALQKFLLANLKYPEDAKTRGIEGTVLTTFIIDANGNVTSAKIIRGVASDIDKEALRLTNSMKGWKPASQNGSTMSTVVTMPIEFALEK